MKYEPKSATTRSFLARLTRDTRGAVLIYVTIVLGAMMAMVALLIDGARLSSTQTDIQDAVDALAIAGAQELDRTDTAITRAKAAMHSVLQNDQRFASGSSTVSVNVDLDTDVRFLATLPADDNDPITVANVTTDPLLARFVEVRVTQVSVPNLFMQVFSSQADATTSAAAVAGHDAAICEITPIFLCNPAEGSGANPEELFETYFNETTSSGDNGFKGRQIQAVAHSGSGSWGPGNWSFLALNCNGANCLRDALSQENPATCFGTTEVDTEPGGNVGPARMGVGVRFDIYSGSLSKNDPGLSPAPSVVSGPKKRITGSNCTLQTNPPNIYVNNGGSPPTYSVDPAATKVPLPRDRCLAGGMNCAAPISGATNTGRVGNGDWYRDEYWSHNHQCGSCTNVTKPANVDATPWGGKVRPWAQVTRWDLYNWEIEQSKLGTNSNDPGAPGCYNGGPMTPDPERRIMYAAVLNCQALESNPPPGGGLNGRKTNPTLGFAKLFLTEPMGQGSSDFNMFLEVVGWVNAEDDEDLLRDITQLYR